jgi:hypothetical protein
MRMIWQEHVTCTGEMSKCIDSISVEELEALTAIFMKIFWDIRPYSPLKIN